MREPGPTVSAPTLSTTPHHTPQSLWKSPGVHRLLSRIQREGRLTDAEEAPKSAPGRPNVPGKTLQTPSRSERQSASRDSRKLTRQRPETLPSGDSLHPETQTVPSQTQTLPSERRRLRQQRDVCTEWEEWFVLEDSAAHPSLPSINHHVRSFYQPQTIGGTQRDAYVVTHTHSNTYGTSSQRPAHPAPTNLPLALPRSRSLSQSAAPVRRPRSALDNSTIPNCPIATTTVSRLARRAIGPAPGAGRPRRAPPDVTARCGATVRTVGS